MNDQAIDALREALRVSPDNVPLRRHLAEMLLSLDRVEEAEHEFRQALSRAPADVPLKIGLARVFYQQNKNSQALVVIEALLKEPQTPAQAYVVHAQLLLRAGEVERAVRQYREALDLDPSVADPDLSSRLGVGPGDEQGEVSEGKVRAAWEE